ncbi:MAG TPA: hemolysin family protein [Bacteroidota bacterium]|nr:hemolysin family protein [Bacteroidota bacterium]
MLWDYFFNTVVVLVVVLLNGFFVAAEFAIVKVRNTQIEPLAEKGNLRAAVAKEMLTHLDAYLSATQLGITMASLALGWIGEPLVSAMISPVCSAVGMVNEKLIGAISVAVGFSIITFLHISVGEQAPKWFAIQKAQGTALFVSYPLKVFFIVFKPIIIAINGFANGILRLLGFGAVSGAELTHSQEELRLLLLQDKKVSTTSKNLVLNAMDFRRKQARHVMVARKEIVAVSISAPIRDSLEIIRTHKYSRYPVYKDTIDNIIGVIHTKDIFRSDRHLKPEFRLESVMREVIVMPETAPLEKVLETMIQKKAHLVSLADEFGGTAGIITMENVLEELVGNIQDEFDREAPEVTKTGENEYVVDAAITTSDVERLLNVELSPREILSLGAFAIEQLGHIPKKGERFRLNGVEFTVESVRDHVIDAIRIKKIPPAKTREKKKKEKV